MSRREGGRLRRAFLLSAAVHAGLLAVIWLTGLREERLPQMRVYAVNIVSPPPQAEGPPTPAVAADPEPEPEPEPDDPEPEPEPTPPPPPPPPPPPERTVTREQPPPREQPRPQPARQPDPEPDPPARAREEPRPSTGARPDPTSAGGDNVNVQLPGVQCPTPDYCNNIIRQINRYFRSPGASGEADVYFVINRNGSVTDLRLVSSTGGASFRLAVLEAVEQAGRNRAFGPLPGAYGADRLPVSFYFRPAR